MVNIGDLLMDIEALRAQGKRPEIMAVVVRYNDDETKVALPHCPMQRDMAIAALMRGIFSVLGTR